MVSSDDHQMSVVGVSWVVRYLEGGGWDISGLMSKGVTHHVIYPMMHVMLPTPVPCGHTHACETVPTYLPLRAVKIVDYIL